MLSGSRSLRAYLFSILLSYTSTVETLNAKNDDHVDGPPRVSTGCPRELGLLAGRTTSVAAIAALIASPEANLSANEVARLFQSRDSDENGDRLATSFVRLAVSVMGRHGIDFQRQGFPELFNLLYLEVLIPNVVSFDPAKVRTGKDRPIQAQLAAYLTGQLKYKTLHWLRDP